MKKKIDFKELIAKKYAAQTLASNQVSNTEIIQNHGQPQNNANAAHQLGQSEVVIPIAQQQFTQFAQHQPPLNTSLQSTNENNSAHLLEEINSLKNFLQQKDLLIEKLYEEKQELATKLAVSESNNLSLSRESIELRADKVELRNDKSRLNEEVLALRQSDLAKAAEIEQLKKEFAEFSLLESNSLVGELHQLNMEHNFVEQQLPNLLIAGNTVNSILLSQEESVVLGDSIGFAEHQLNLDEL